MPQSDRRKNEMKEIIERLEQGIQELFVSEKYTEYLRTMSKFHDYSSNNIMLIAMQKPDASYVAGYQSWQKNFGRHVMKGEKGIRILVPTPYQITVEQEVKDSAGHSVIGADGRPETEKVKIKVPAYKTAAVFDVSQTEGKELPSIIVNELSGNIKDFNLYMEAIKEISPVPIEYKNISSGAKGYFSSSEQKIVLQEGMSEMQTAKTAIHELAHINLHDTKFNPDMEKKGRRTKEVEAESVAYAVCQYYGLDTSEYSFGYIAGWSSGKELSELKSSLEIIRNTAAEIINDIDEHIVELQKTHELAAKQEKTTKIDVNKNIVKQNIAKSSIMDKISVNKASIEQQKKHNPVSERILQERGCR